MNIIGICGRAGAGKDTAADVLVKSFGFVKVSLTDPMKRICKEVFGFTDEQLWGPSERRNESDTRLPRFSKEARERLRMDDTCPPLYLTPRYALQRLGTEWGRDCYPDVWVDYAMRVAKRLLTDADFPDYDGKSGMKARRFGYRAQGVVIPDVRFPNEVAAIRAAGGRIWKIDRSITLVIGESTSEAKHASNFESWRRHVSEAHVNDIVPDVTIDNDSDLARFRLAVEWIMRHDNDTFLSASALELLR